MFRNNMNSRITINSDLKNIRHAVDQVVGVLHETGAEASDIFDIRLCLEEALINAVKYGNGLDKAKKVLVDFQIKNGQVNLSVTDSGKGFDHMSLPDPTVDENILRGNGRGVFLIRHLMDKVAFNEKGNAITMRKTLKTKPRTKQKGDTL
jgi:serine/threonine-protein kinase RsbW